MKKTKKKKAAACYEVSIEPSLKGFHEAIDGLLLLYSEVITSFIPLSKDPRIATYTTAALFDFLTRLAEENVDRSEVIPELQWPDVGTLLHEYAPYEDATQFIRTVIGETVKEVTQLSKVRI